MKREARKSGFTLVELMLSMAFVSVLLIAIALLTIQLSKQYTRGLTLKAINQTSTEVGNDMRRTLSATVISGNIGIQRKEHKLTSGTKENNVIVICGGGYSYIANSPTSLEESGYPVVTYEGTTDPVRLARIYDDNAAYCQDDVFDSSSELGEGAAELLSGGDRSFVVRDMEVASIGVDLDATPPAGVFLHDFEAGRAIYRVSLTLSTGVSEELDLVGSVCKPPIDASSNAEYCAINRFDFTIRVGNAS